MTPVRSRKPHPRPAARDWLRSFLLPIIVGMAVGAALAPAPYGSVMGIRILTDQSSSERRYETSCTNRVDDDADGLADCDDIADCSNDSACREICDNRIDDDRDGATDCDDLSCEDDPACWSFDDIFDVIDIRGLFQSLFDGK